MSKHTPGPWALHPIAKTAVVGSKGFVVAACGGHSNNMDDPEVLHDELCANARLVAAAPAMLEALQDVVAFWDSITMEDCVNDKHVKARAAIAMATGSAP